MVAWQQNGRIHSLKDHWFAKIHMVLSSVTGDEESQTKGHMIQETDMSMDGWYRDLVRWLVSELITSSDVDLL